MIKSNNSKWIVLAKALKPGSGLNALGIGHHAKTIKKIADILGIEAVIVKGDPE